MNDARATPPATGTDRSPAPVRVAVIGTRGFGRVHLDHLAGLVADRRAELVGVVDVLEPEQDPGAPWFPSLSSLLEAAEAERIPAPEVVVIATPIPAHVPLALEALAAGCDVYLEKPPVPSLADHWMLLRAAREAGRSVQVGFQARGGSGVDALRELLASGSLGPVRAVTAHGAWTRDRAYYARSPWAGKRRANGVRVADGVATNPLAHAVHAALTIAGITRADQIREITTELRHAHDIEADDTTFLRVDPRDAGVPPVLAALTTTAPAQLDPWVEVVGERGRARLFYTVDRAEIAIDGEPVRSVSYERTDLVQNLLDHVRDRSVPLVSPLVDTSAFTAVLDATQSVPDPVPIGPEHIEWVGEGASAHPVVRDVEGWLERALGAGRPFSEIGAPWADPSAVHTWSPRTVVRRVELAGTEVAVEVDGSDIIDRSSPRPYLHPLRTLAGVVLTDAHPADHDWHCGLSVTMPDAGGVNFWGGRTYTAENGYVWRADHGRIDLETSTDGPDGAWTEELRWSGPTEAPESAVPEDESPARVELVETRDLRASLVEGGWALDLAFRLRPEHPASIELGSPGSHGRVGGGYGGLFLRLAPIEDAQVTAGNRNSDEPVHRGEAEVHGSRTDWIEVRARIDGHEVALTIEHVDEHRDPWFVRIEDYPGIGSSLAWEEPVTASTDVPIERAFRLTLRDLEDRAASPASGPAAPPAG